MHADDKLPEMQDRMIMKLRGAPTLTEAGRVCSEQGFCKRAMSLVMTPKNQSASPSMFDAAIIMRDPCPDNRV